MALRFHWSFTQAGDTWRKARTYDSLSGVPDLQAHVEFARCAERNGIESLLLAFSFNRPDPVVLATAVGMATERIILMVACRPGVLSPVVFVQQINTVSALVGGRVSINVVAGHSPHEHAYYGDFLGHDERYDRAREFLDICRAFWRGEAEVTYEGRHYRIERGRLKTPFLAAEGSGPEIYLGGNSPPAEDLAARHASCLLRYPDTPERMRPGAAVLARTGTRAGVRIALVGRPTREEAVAAALAVQSRARELSQGQRRQFVGRTDSVAFRSTLALADAPDGEWLKPWLWTGAVPYVGEVCLVGSAADIAAALLEYGEAGVTDFLFSGWPDETEMDFFGGEILPLVRRAEQAAQPAAASRTAR
ncbi:MAG TPA: LLM class flavin-dependent oxidoreductase [Thermoanaerobaculia bacterium]|jgi:alkanesulfonate monooxygenase|nr:LLM class flavin-dependent oxidoreductase [Thermoanaerobaculia bacterium]